MPFIVIGIVLIVLLAPFTFFNVRSSLRKQNREVTRSIYLFPIVQVGGGLIIIGMGVWRMVH